MKRLCTSFCKNVYWRRFTSIPDGKESDGERVNDLGIQMLSKSLYQQIFRCNSRKEPSPAVISRSIEHLKELGLWGKKGSTLPDVSFTLPSMHGEDIDQHFQTIAKSQSQPYLNLAKTLAAARLQSMPVKWSSRPGWTRYDPDSDLAEQVEFPQDEALVLDVEVCVSESQRPILAVAVSPKAWYSWTSKRLHSSEDAYYELMKQNTLLEDLIPMEAVSHDRTASEQCPARLVVGHNVSYDRARTREQYLIKVRQYLHHVILHAKCLQRPVEILLMQGTKMKFLDTLSLHMCIAGQTSHQKGMWMSRKKKEASEKKREVLSEIPTLRSKPIDLWMEVTSPNNLADVHWLHVRKEVQGKKRKLDKARRDVFVKGTVQDIREDFQVITKPHPKAN